MSNISTHHTFETGGCWQNEKLILPDKPFRKVFFPSTFTLIEHKTEGLIMFDTGYAPRMDEICQNFPEILYAIVTPLHIKEEDSALEIVKRKGYSANDIKYIVVSHFHADHIAGLKDFPKSKIVYKKKALDSLLRQNKIRALTNAFLKDLVPSDISERCINLDNMEKNIFPYSIEGFHQGWDLFNDNSLLIVDLPGHCDGHIGMFVNSLIEPSFLVGDACWSEKSFQENIMPSQLSRLVHHNFKEYKISLQKIHDLYTSNQKYKIVPCHCMRESIKSE